MAEAHAACWHCLRRRGSLRSAACNVMDCLAAASQCLLTWSMGLCGVALEVHLLVPDLEAVLCLLEPNFS